MNKEISKQVDNWIAIEELPTKPGLKKIRRFDDVYPNDEDERRAYWDWQKWGFEYDHLIIKAIKRKPGFRYEPDFWEEWRA